MFINLILIMLTSDIFEFKPLTHDERLLLKECKVMIKELNDQLNQALQTIEKKQNEVDGFRKDKAHLQSMLEESRMKQKQLNEIIHEMKKKKSEEEKKDEQMRMKVKQMDEEISLLKQEKRSMRIEIEKMEELSQKQKKWLEEKKDKMKIMQETVELLMEENNKLNTRLQEKDQETKWDIEELKQINENIKERFKVNYEQQSTFFINYPTPTKQRSASTDKKLANNQIYLTDKKLTEGRQIMKRNPLSTIKPINLAKQKDNPELGEQIRSIKKQIANQYTLLEMKKQGYCKERVDKTLDELKRKVTRMVENVEKSDSQSCFD